MAVNCTLISAPVAVTDPSALPKRNPVWTPAMLAGLVDYWDCEVGVAADGSAAVTSWTGQAAGKVAASVNGFAKPVRNRDFNGRAGLSFNSALLSIAALGMPAADILFYAVFETLTDPDGTRQYLFSSAPMGYAVNHEGNGNKSLLEGTRLSVSASLVGPAALVGSKHILVVYQLASGTIITRVDGVQTDMRAATSSPAAIGLLDIGMYYGRQTTTYALDTALAGFGFASGDRPDLLEVQKLEGFLAQRFCPANFLPVAHPYRSVAPRRLT